MISSAKHSGTSSITSDWIRPSSTDQDPDTDPGLGTVQTFRPEAYFRLGTVFSPQTENLETQFL